METFFDAYCQFMVYISGYGIYYHGSIYNVIRMVYNAIVYDIMLWYGKACYGVVSNSMVEDIMGKIQLCNKLVPHKIKTGTYIYGHVPRAKSDAAINSVPHTIEKSKVKLFYRINYKKMPKESTVQFLSLWCGAQCTV